MQQNIAVLYGSETGTAQEVAERIAQDLAMLARRAGADDVRVQLAPMDGAPPLERWGTAFTLAVFVVATAGNGDPPRTMRSTWRELLRRGCPRLDGLRFAVLGLGDSTYARFNYMAKMLHNRLEKLGAAPALHRALGDDEDPQGYETEARAFLDSLYFDVVFPALAPPVHVERRQAAAAAAAASGTDAAESQSASSSALPPIPPPLYPSPELYEPLWTLDVLPAGIASTTADVTKHLTAAGPLREFAVMQNARVTTPDHFQDVRSIRVAPVAACDAPAPFLPGDTFVVLPQAPPAAVAATLRMLRLRPDDVVTLRPNPRCAVQHGGSGSDMQRHAGVAFRADELFSRVLDVQAAVPRQLLYIMSGWRRRNSGGGGGGDDDEVDEVVERLEQLSRLSMDDFMEYVTRERRPVHEMLEDFWPMILGTTENEVDATTIALAKLDELSSSSASSSSSSSSSSSVRFPPNWRSIIVSHLRPIAPRHFSIANFYSAADPAVELLVAIHQVTTPMGRLRAGLCSAFLAQSPPVVLGYVDRGVHTLPAATAAASSPMLLVGPGTGIAPIRAVLQRRIAEAKRAASPPQEDASPAAPVLVFTGHRHPEKDFAFGAEWAQIARGRADLVEFVHCFSRSAASSAAPFKYVQHAVSDPRYRARVAAALRRDDCIVIISGNAKQMPKDVFDAFVECLASDAGFVATVVQELHEEQEDEEFDEEEDGGGKAPLSAERIAEAVEEAARNHLDRMRQAGRYVVDAWA